MSVITVDPVKIRHAPARTRKWELFKANNFELLII